MAVNTVGVRSRRKREAAAFEAKEKRQKIMLAVCGVVLVALVAFEGPKTLKRLHGSSTAVPPAAIATPAPATTAQPAGGRLADAPALKHLAAKDPFVAQLGTGPASLPVVTSVAPPAVRAKSFTAKDPFAAQVSVSAPSAPGAAPTQPVSPHGPSTGRSGNYIVVLASIPLAAGRGAAAQAAATARKQGVGQVRIVTSSAYPTLRTGFYAVYSGPYGTLADLAPALQQVRGEGYPSAYTRRLAH